MKKLLSITLIGLMTISAFSQKEKRGFKKSEMTPDQVAELHTKKMTLDLELTNAQQKKVYDLKKEHAIERDVKRKERQALREKGEKPTKKNSFERKNARLDAQLIHQKEMKNILNDGQFETWKKFRKHNGDKMRKKGKRKMMKRKLKSKKGLKRKEGKN